MYRSAVGVTTLVVNASRGAALASKRGVAMGISANLGECQTVGSNVLFPAEDGVCALLSTLRTSSKSTSQSEKYVDDRLRDWKNGVDVSQLSEGQLEVHREHLKAVEAGEDMYVDPVTGFEVFTILNHLRRGSCCGNLCRHCPYKYANVSERYKCLKTDNTAFYS